MKVTFHLLLIFLIFSIKVSAQWKEKIDLTHFPYFANGRHYVRNISFYSSHMGIYNESFSTGSAHGNAYNIIRTDDGWDSFKKIYGIAGGGYDNYHLADMFFLNDSIGYQLSSFMAFIEAKKTIDGGYHWTKIPNDTNIFRSTKLFYPSEDLGYYLNSQSIILSDNGKCTLKRFPKDCLGGYNLHFVNDSIGFVFCRDTLQNYVCLRTIDFGQNWDKVLENKTIRFNDIHFPTESTGFICGENGSAFKTTNVGENWDSLSIAYSSTLNSVCFVTDSIGYMAGAEGLVLKTIDGGQNWNSEASGTDQSIKTIFFEDVMTGYFATQNKVYKSITTGVVDQKQSRINVKLFPNPVDDFVTIKIEKLSSKVSVSIYSIQGVKLTNSTYFESDFSIDLTGFNPGIYIIQFNIDGEILTRKFLKK